MRRYNRHLIILAEVPAALVVIVQLYNRPFPLWGYLIAAGALAFLAALSLLTSQEHRVFVFVQIFLLAILVRSAPYIALRYSVIPGGDSYGEYAVLVSFLDSGRFSPLHGAGRGLGEGITGYSGWPGLQLFSMAVSQVTAIDPLYVTMIIPWAFFVGSFLFAFLLFRYLEGPLCLPPLATHFALLMMAASPFVPIPPIYKHQDMALGLWSGILYLAYRRLSDNRVATAGLLSLLLVALVVTHHYTSFMAMLYLTLISVFFFFWRFTARPTEPGPPASAAAQAFFLRAGQFALISLFLWWNNYAVVIWPYVASAIKGVEQALKTLTFASSHPELVGGLRQLTPAWVLDLLIIRGVAMFVPAGVGLLMLVRRWSEAPQRLFTIHSTLVLAVPGLLDALFAGVAVPYRGALLWIYFIAILSALFYVSLARRIPFLGKGLLFSTAAMFVFAAFMGFWAYRYAPMHFFDAKVSFQQAGEHPLGWRRMARFLHDRIDYQRIETFLTDQIYGMGLALPVGQWSKIAGIGYRGTGPEGNTLVVAYNNLNIASYVDQWRSYLDPDFDEEAFRHRLESKLLIFNDGEFKVWR